MLARGLAVVALAAAGCSHEPALQRGTELFSMTSFSASPSNYFSCSTCHVVTPAADSRVLPGATMYDAASRSTYWGGQFDDLFDAVNYCYVELMRGTPLSRDDTDGRAVLVYLDSLAPDPGPLPPLPLTIVKNVAPICSGPTDTSCGGSQVCTLDMMTQRYYCDLPIPADWATAGADLYQRGCGNCHGALHSGDGRLGPSVSLIPDESIANHGTDPATGARAVTIEKVRHGKFFGVGGNMAPYGLEYLSEQQEAEILGYIFAGNVD